VKYLKMPGLRSEVSRLILGTLDLHQFSSEFVDELLNEWLVVGGNCIDTARDYGAGASERILGRWLRRAEVTNSVVIITKGGHPDTRSENRVNPRDIRADLEKSLDALQRDTIDLYLLHRDDAAVPVGEIMDALNEVLAEGRILAFGASNWSTKRLGDADDYASSHGLAGFSCSSPNLSLAVQNEPPWPGCISASDVESRRWYENTQLPLLAWSSQAGGFFTGIYSPSERSHADAVRVYYSEDNWLRARRAQQLAEIKGCTAHEVALAWVLHQRFPTCAVIGAHSVDELRSSIQALDVELSPDEVRWLNLELSRLPDLNSGLAGQRQFRGKSDCSLPGAKSAIHWSARHHDDSDSRL